MSVDPAISNTPDHQPDTQSDASVDAQRTQTAPSSVAPATPAPAPAPAQSQPQPPQAPQTQAPQAQTSQASASAPQPQQPDYFKSILGILAGGGRKSVRDPETGQPMIDPATGQMRTMDATKGDLGKSILAGALSAMATSFQHMPSQDEGGRWHSNRNEAAQAGFESGQKSAMNTRLQNDQQTADATRMRQYQTMDQNMKFHSQAMAIARLDDEDIRGVTAEYAPLYQAAISNPAFKGALLNDGNLMDESELLAEAKKTGDASVMKSAIPAGTAPAMGADGRPTGHLKQMWLGFHNNGMIDLDQMDAESRQKLIDAYHLPQTAAGLQSIRSLVTLGQNNAVASIAESAINGFVSQQNAASDSGKNDEYGDGKSTFSLKDLQAKDPYMRTTKGMALLQNITGSTPGEAIKELKAKGEKGDPHALQLANELSEGVGGVSIASWDARTAAAKKLEEDQRNPDKQLIDQKLVDSAYPRIARYRGITPEQAADFVTELGPHPTEARYKDVMTRVQAQSDTAINQQLAQRKEENKEKIDNPTGISSSTAFDHDWADPKTGKHWDLAAPQVNTVEGGEDPSQFTKRSKSYDANLHLMNDYSFARYGVPFNMAKATSDYTFSKAPQTQNMMKLIRSLTGDNTNTGGTLAQLQQQFDALGNTPFPSFNDIKNWGSKQIGHDPVTNFQATAYGVYDELAKIVGGGVATVEGYRTAQQLLSTAFSKGQGKGAVNSVRGVMAQRQNALVGEGSAANRYMVHDYGKMVVPQVGAAAHAARPAGAVKQVPGSDGKLHYLDAQNKDLGVVQP